MVSAGMCWTRTPVAVLQMWKGLGRAGVGVLGSIHLSPRTLRVNLYSGGEGGGWINNALSHCRGEISDWNTAYSTYWRPYDKNVSALHHAGDQPAATFVPAMRSFECEVSAPFPFSSTLSSGSLAGNVPPDPVRGNVQVKHTVPVLPRVRHRISVKCTVFRSQPHSSWDGGVTSAAPGL